MNGRRWLLPVAIAVALMQIGFLFSMIAGRAAILRDGREVVLQVLPVDPRDLLRGDYVVLRYNISSIAGDLFVERPDDSEAATGRAVFVRLKADGDGIWQPVAARFHKGFETAPGEDEVDIRGTSDSRWFAGETPTNVEYGIERFYVPEGEGRAIELADRRTRVFRMKVAVARDGAAQIKSFHDGETMLYAEPFY